MNSFAQLRRQPLKSLSGVILIALAVAILCVCVGQAAAAANMRTAMEKSYKTVALPTNRFLLDADPQQVWDWTQQLLEENPDVILEDSRIGLASAWIEALSSDNYVSYLRSDKATHARNAFLVGDLRGAPYTCAMLEVEVSAIHITTETILLEGKVTQVIALADTYNDPTGYGIHVTMEVSDPAVLEEMSQIQPGDRCLTYCMDYTDLDWVLRSTVIEDSPAGNSDGYSATAGMGFQVQQFTPENLFFLNDDVDEPEEWQAMVDAGRGHKNVAYYRQDFIKENGKNDYYIEAFSAWEMLTYYNKVSYTLVDYSTVTGNADHATPTIVRLEGTAEEFLASSDSSLWQQALADMQVSNHTFPILGVDDLRYIADFAKQDTVITDGRIFSDEELASGAPVCIISDILAEKNGLHVGQTISTQYFTPDASFPLYSDISQNEGLINPTAGFYTSGAHMQEQPVVYTIVGIYSQSALWDTTAENLYAFTPNTIFVPESTVTSQMQYSDHGLFRTLLLQNGTMTEFRAMLSASGLENLFVCYDQGYSDLVDNLYSYDMIAQQALQIGLIVYAIVIGLYFLLFPSRQGKELATMSSLGAERNLRVRHVFCSGLGILIPGSILGILLGIALRQEVIDALTQTAAVALPLEMDIRSLVVIGLLQLLFAAAITLLVAIPMTRNKSLMKRSSFLERFKQLRKTPLYTWAVTGLALIVSFVLCALNASNEAEYANFEKAKLEIPITLTVTDPRGEKSTGLELKGWVADVFSGEFDWGLSKYLKEVNIKMHQKITQVNGQAQDLRLQGLMSVASAIEINGTTGGHVTWFDGYDESILLTKEMVCLVPEGFEQDADPATPEQEVDLYFYAYWAETDSMGAVTDSGSYEYSCRLTVVGTYYSTVGAEDFYAPYYVARAASTKLGLSPRLESASAVLNNNDELEEFLEVAHEYFLEPGPEADPDGIVQYGLKIEVGSLKKAEAVLNNSLTVNRISTYLVFILSTLAGFFVGFLMIRSRKRDILLMRTLGRSNYSIYFDFAMQQLGYVLLGIAVGGAFYLWQPLMHLGMFALLYFIGLSTALVVFLNSKLITNTKEDE